MTPNIQTPTFYSHISNSSASAMHPQSVSSPSLCEKNHIPIFTVQSRTATSVYTSVPSTSCSSSLPPLMSSSTTLNPPLPPCSASSSLTSTPPIPKPRTVQLVIKDDGTSDKKLPEISVVKRPECLASRGQLVVHSTSDVANVVQTPPEKESETVPQLQNNSGSKTRAQKDSENTGSPEVASQQKQNVTSQETEGEEKKQSATGTKPKAQLNVLITDAPKAENVNIQEIIPKEVEPKSLTSAVCKITPKTETDCAATVQTDTKAPEKTLIGCEFGKVPNEKSENVLQRTTYLARPHERQRMSYCELDPPDIDMLETVDSLKGSIHTSVPATTNSHISKDSGDDSTHSQQGNPSVTSAHHTDNKPNTAKHKHLSITSQESQQTPKAQGSLHTPERPLRLYFLDTHMPDLCSRTAEQESRPLTAVVRTPTPDGFLPRMPTPDSRMHTPEPRPYTPASRMPTPGVSDGYISPRGGSTVSTTSEEYYECSDSSFHEPVFDRAAFRNHGTTVDHDSFTQTNTPNATTITTTATSPAYINNTTSTTMLGTTDSNTSSNETQSLSGPARVSTSDHLKQAKESTEVVDKDQEAQPQAPKRKQVLNQSAGQRLVDRGVTPSESTKKATDAKRLSTGDLNPEKVSSEKPDKEKVVDKALKPGGVERRDRPQSTRETEGQRVSFQYAPAERH
ncbi:uncharacterized protein PB18E9.04c-like [Xiphias gladius]|uniref:uncharacterized protein PB18E9.04c-like n=1 Tax=Xiphias gladius TaxID=8245 RepID=UPI001A9981B1|nr:uncharacterized protein PB18E9.04c-like [Xiphias gladius]